MRKLAAVVTGGFIALACAGTAHADPDDNATLVGPSAEGQASVDQPFSVGTGAIDTFGGYLPNDVTLTPFDVINPVIGRLDPALLAALQEATKSAAAQGVDIEVNSGWRSQGFQQRLFDDAVRTYGNADLAQQFVASPETSMHVQGKAVDVGPPSAAGWMSANGSQFGLCQVYANELWHYELTADAAGQCPPMKPNAAG